MALIAENVSRCLQSFQTLSSMLAEQSVDSSTQLLLTIKDELARFKVWLSNIGAHRYGRSSLDYRLRDASHLRERVTGLLEDLNNSLNDGIFPCHSYSQRETYALCISSSKLLYDS